MQVASEPSQWVCDEPECGSRRFVDRDGFRWCLGCGAGTPILELSGRVPGVGSDTHYAPENQLSFGKDLGNPGINSRYNGKALFQVLGQRNRKDLGVRSIQVRNECMRAQEHPISQRMKDYGSNLSKASGYGDNVLLSNALGFDLQWISMILIMQKDGRHSKDLAEAAFLLNVKKFFGEKKAVQIMKRIWGREKNGRLVIPKSKKLYLSKARELIQLDRLIV